jgi:hypothetical protein
LRDVETVSDGETHLLGSIVCLTGAHTSGINDLELVDGQQRITTIMIVLICIGERLKDADPSFNPSSIESLLRATAYGVESKPKLALDSLDSGEFQKHATRAAVPKPTNPRLAAAFQTVRSWASGMPPQDLYSFLFKLKTGSLVIRLEVSEAKDAFKLFETINNRGLSLSPTDIIKNFVLGYAARFGGPSLELARARWTDLIAQLDGTSLDAFFRHYLCAKLKRRITVSFVIANFKATFLAQVTEASSLAGVPATAKATGSTDDPSDPLAGQPSISLAKASLPPMTFADFLDELVVYATKYGEIVRCSTGNTTANRHLDNLRRINALQTFGFLMALRTAGCDDKTFIEILRLTEAFLMRRHTCRERANENESLFARLCSIDAGNPLGEITTEYRKLTPTDDKFRRAFADENFTANLIERARYCLEQFEYRLQGKYVELTVSGSSAVHVEHIIPQKIKSKQSVATHGDWVAYLGDGSVENHSRYVARIGNLTLISGTLNVTASNGPYQKKRDLYRQSALRITKAVADDSADFRFSEVDARSAMLADLAVQIWPAP